VNLWTHTIRLDSHLFRKQAAPDIDWKHKYVVGRRLWAHSGTGAYFLKDGSCVGQSDDSVDLDVDRWQSSRTLNRHSITGRHM
jgi:hypothetical protein